MTGIRRRGFLGRCCCGVLAAMGWRRPAGDRLETGESPGEVQLDRIAPTCTLQFLDEVTSIWPQRVQELCFKRSPISGEIACTVFLEKSLIAVHLDPGFSAINYRLHVGEPAVCGGLIDIPSDDFESRSIEVPGAPVANSLNAIGLCLSSR